MSSLLNFIKDEEGASMAEYALLLGIVTVAIVTVLTAFGSKVSTSITNATDAIK